MECIDSFGKTNLNRSINESLLLFTLSRETPENELNLAKTGLKTFVVVILKEGLAGTIPDKAFFWYNTHYY